MDKIAKSPLLEPRPFLFKNLIVKSDLQEYFDIVKRDETIYFVAAQNKETNGTLFVGPDLTMRFFLNVDCADQYRESCQSATKDYHFFIVRFQATNGIAKAIADVQTSTRQPAFLMVSKYKKDILVDIDLVYSTKQLLN